MSTAGRIIRHATDIFFTEGVATLTMDRLANDLGMSKRTLYQRVGRKEELLRAIVERFFEDLQEGLLPVVDDDTPIESLHALIQIAGRHLSAVRWHQVELRRASPDVWSHVERLREAVVIQPMERLIRYGRHTGAIRVDIDPDLTTALLRTAIDSYSNERALRALDTSAGDLFQQIASIFLDGITPRT